MAKVSQEKSGSLKGNSVSTAHNQSDQGRSSGLSFFCNRAPFPAGANTPHLACYWIAKVSYWTEVHVGEQATKNPLGAGWGIICFWEDWPAGCGVDYAL